nr:hypothetical protein [Tanacetum cinerariifolium]
MTFHEGSLETRACSLHISSLILVRTMASISVGGFLQKGLIDHSLNGFWNHVVWVGVVRKSNWSLSCHRCHDSSKSQESKRELSSAAHTVLAARHACRPSLVSCLPSLGESLPSVPNAYAVSGVSGAETRVHTPAPGESEAHNGLPDSILLSEPKPLMQHMPHPP